MSSGLLYCPRCCRIFQFPGKISVVVVVVVVVAVVVVVVVVVVIGASSMETIQKCYIKRFACSTAKIFTHFIQGVCLGPFSYHHRFLMQAYNWDELGWYG